jgi:hypothetical protein
MKKRYGIIVVSSLFLVLLSIGAGCTTQQSAPQAEAQLCQDLGQLDAALAQLEDITRTSTIGELKAAEENVTKAMQQVRESGQAVAEARTRELDTAYQNLENGIRAIPDDATIAEGRASIQEELAAVRTAERQLKTDARCA